MKTHYDKQTRSLWLKDMSDEEQAYLLLWLARLRIPITYDGEVLITPV